MNIRQPRIIFHKLSRSKSKEKGSPYRNQFKIKHKNHDAFVQNVNKLDIRQHHPDRFNEIKRLDDLKPFDRTKPKLKLTIESKTNHSEPAEYKRNPLNDLVISKETLSTFLQTQNMSIYNQLLYKIQQQTHLIKLHFKQIKRSIKRNNCQNEQQKQSHKQPNKDQQCEQNYQELLKYLQQLKKNSGEVQILKHVIQKYEQEIHKLKQQIIEWQQKYNSLEHQIDYISSKSKSHSKSQSFHHIQRINDQEQQIHNDQKANMDDNEPVQKQVNEKGSNLSNQSISQKDRELQPNKSFEKKTKIYFNSLDNHQSVGSLHNESLNSFKKSQKTSKNQYLKKIGQSNQEIKAIKKQYNELKYVNSLLYDKINQLSEQIQDKDQQIIVLKRQISRIDEYHNVSSSIHLNVDETSIEETQNNNNLQESYKKKSINQFVPKRKSSQKAVKFDSRYFDRKERKNMTQNSQNNQGSSMLSNEHSNTPVLERPQSQNLNNHQNVIEDISFGLSKTKFSQIGQQQIQQSIRKIRKRHNSIKFSAETKKRLIQQKIQQKEIINVFGKDNMKNLQLVSRTIYYKMKAFKQNFQTLQTKLIEQQQYYLTKQSIQDILKKHPFHLHDRLTAIVTKYIIPKASESLFSTFSNVCSHEQPILIDYFINKLKQFIPEITFMDDQQQIQLILNLKKFLLMCNEQLREQYQRLHYCQSFITEAQLRKLLKSVNFNPEYIDFIISQCSIISIDIDNLNLNAFLSVYQENI